MPVRTDGVRQPRDAARASTDAVAPGSGPAASELLPGVVADADAPAMTARMQIQHGPLLLGR